MRLNAIDRLAAGLLLLALAAWWVPSPHLHPRPDLPEIAPFSAGERIALILPDPETFPPPDRFGLVQRARAAGAEVRVFAPGDPFGDFSPSRIYQPVAWPDTPAGYHPDQWPAPPPGGNGAGNGGCLFVLAPGEMAVKNQAVLAAARTLRDSGGDDPQGTREAEMLSRARRAEIYRSLNPRTAGAGRYSE